MVELMKIISVPSDVQDDMGARRFSDHGLDVVHKPHLAYVSKVRSRAARKIAKVNLRHKSDGGMRCMPCKSQRRCATH